MDTPRADFDDLPDTELPPEAEARLQALLAEQAARRQTEDAARQERRAIWRTHHWAAEYDRCAVVGGRHVCRRCLTLYPIALVVMTLSLMGVPPWPAELDVWFVWGLCIPATLDFMAEKLAGVAYSPRRQVIVTALVAVAVGRGLAHEIDDRWTWIFWGPVLVFGSLWFLAAVTKARNTMFEKALAASLESGEMSQRGAATP